MRRPAGSLVSFVILFPLLAACTTFKVPKDYVPDEKVVFLKEKVEFGPIKYAPRLADPYVFAPDAAEVKADTPAHLMIGESSGLICQLPVWLNEGLAVYVESMIDPETSKYWDTTFTVSRDMKRLLDWNQVTTQSTGDFPIAQARVHYAQSFALVRVLVAKLALDLLKSAPPKG